MTSAGQPAQGFGRCRQPRRQAAGQRHDDQDQQHDQQCGDETDRSAAASPRPHRAQDQGAEYCDQSDGEQERISIQGSIQHSLVHRQLKRQGCRFMARQAGEPVVAPPDEHAQTSRRCSRLLAEEGLALDERAAVDHASDAPK